MNDGTCEPITATTLPRTTFPSRASCLDASAGPWACVGDNKYCALNATPPTNTGVLAGLGNTIGRKVATVATGWLAEVWDTAIDEPSTRISTQISTQSGNGTYADLESCEKACNCR